MEVRGVGIELRFASLNGIRVRFAEAGPKEGPLILFCHGWPESWYSWRHQLAACAKAGYHVVAPDMRGYGGTTAPKNVAEYNIYALAGDAIGLLTFLGYDKAILVGHDWGADFVWKLAALFPETFTAVCAMSVPYTGQVIPLLSLLKKVYGDPFDKDSNPKFFYMLHHNLPEAAIEYGSDVREALYRLYCNRTDDKAAASPPEITDEHLYIKGEPVGMVKRAPRPSSLPAWLSEEELQYYVREFERVGFEGGLNWYRKMDIDASLMQHIDGQQITQPALFIGGSDDMVIERFGGGEAVKGILDKVCADLKKVVIYEGCGHWIQQEKAEEVNAELLSWLADLDTSDVMPRTKARL